MLLELDGIEKRFGGVHALRRGDLHADSGQVHALLGENGAGKSTMMKIIAGMQRRDGGSMRWRGEVVDFASPKEAHAVGISMVHQESLLAPHLTVAENVFLGQETLSGPLLDQKTMLAETRKLIEEHRFPLQADWRVERLSPAQKQLVEIVRALHGSSSLIIFDEPTSSLSDSETVEVFRIVKQLRERGVAILYITHRLVELDEIADHVTILRDGETVHSCPYSEIDMAGIVHHMVGRNVEHIYEREPALPGAETVAVDLPGAKFEVRAGEIVGIAGLMGAGRTELCQTLFGITPADEGEIRVEGRPVSIRSPRQAVDAGIALITEDRQRTGLALALPIRPNVTLAHLDGVTRSGFVQAAEEKQVAERYIERLRIRASGTEQRAGKLSGGNQQKIVIAKWLYRDTKVVLFDEPTRGIDVNAKREVFSLMDEMAREGKAIVMVSSELPELLQVADRILVMREGEIVAELPRSTTQEQIMHYAAVGQ
ncbi:MAG: sugar ABC transporter ATP-binding protein [Acidobacteria bacterium]|nr:sugar ABC transporter ATP-binding protein [Acidobacteriota bacterium]